MQEDRLQQHDQWWQPNQHPDREPEQREGLGAEQEEEEEEEAKEWRAE